MADWQKGDLALCVCGSYNPTLNNPQVIPGFVGEVEAVLSAHDGVVLVLKGAHSAHQSRAHHASRFIKVTPQSEDAFDREVIAHMAGQEVEA